MLISMHVLIYFLVSACQTCTYIFLPAYGKLGFEFPKRQNALRIIGLDRCSFCLQLMIEWLKTTLGNFSFQSVTDTYYKHSGTRLRTSTLYTTRYNSDVMYEEFQGVSLFTPSCCREAQVSLTIEHLIMELIHIFLVWLITDVVCQSANMNIFFLN